MSALWITPVREYMSKALVSVKPDTPLTEVERLFEERDISAVPVIGEDGALRGIVSITDLMRVARIELTAPRAIARIVAPLTSAGDISKPDVVTIAEAAPLRDAADAMVKHRIHRVVVLRDERPVAILSARDALLAVLFHRVELPLERVMTKEVETVDLGTSILAAIDQLADANVRGLVVVDGKSPVGVFTQTELLRAKALPKDLLRMPIEELMSYEILALDEDTPLYRVAGQAIKLRARRVLAVKGRELRGIASGYDLVRVMTMDDV